MYILILVRLNFHSNNNIMQQCIIIYFFTVNKIHAYNERGLQTLQAFSIFPLGYTSCISLESVKNVHNYWLYTNNLKILIFKWDFGVRVSFYIIFLFYILVWKVEAMQILFYELYVAVKTKYYTVHFIQVMQLCHLD